ncbi:MAG: TonB-dependent receptor [Pseudomonadota bacterium]
MQSIFLLVGLLFASPPTTAEEQPEPLDDIVVTANVSERRAFTTGRSVDAVDREDLERQLPESVPDALQDTPGVHVQKTNAGAGAPFIRGLVGPENLILVDGVRFNNSTFRTGPNQYLALFDPGALDRIEVLHGPGSVLYGSDAMGGVIHLLTRDPSTPEHRSWGFSGRLTGATAWLGLGGDVQGDLEVGRYRGYLGGSYSHSGELRHGARGDAPVTAATRAGLHPLSDFARSSLRFKNVVDLGRGMTLTGAFFSTFIRDAGRSDNLWNGDYRFYDNDDLLSYLRWESKGGAWLRRIRLTLSHHHTNEVQRRTSCPTTAAGRVVDRSACLAGDDGDLLGRRRLMDTVHTPGVAATLESRFWRGRLQTLLGLEGYFDLVGSSREDAKAPGWGWVEKSRGNFSDGSTYLSAGAFLRGEAEVVQIQSHVLALDAGVRLSHFAADAGEVPGLGDVAYRFTGVVGSGGVQYRYADWFNLYVDFSQGFRAPNLQETTVLGNTGSTFEVPNGALRPVRSDTLEVGLKARIPWVHLHGAAFLSWIDDVFDREDVPEAEWAALGLSAEEVGGYRVVRRVNATEAFYRGFEARAVTERFHGVSAWANVAWVEGDVTRRDGTVEPGRRVPPLSGAGGLRYDPAPGRISAEIFVRWAARQARLSSGDREDLRICADPARPWTTGDTCSGTPPWWTLNARVGWAATDWLKVALRFENLGDVRYRTHGSGVYGPGFNFLADLAVRF